jgi:hypothetical protein
VKHVALAVLIACLSTSILGQGTPTKTEMTADGRLLVNGKPYFFIGTSPGPELILKTPEGGDGWAELAAGGINVVRGYPGMHDADSTTIAQVKQYMDNAIAHGVYVWPILWHVVERDNDIARTNLKKIIEVFKNHPATFFWKFSDEPEWGKVPVAPLQKSYQLTRQLDPNHLVWIAHAPRGTLQTLKPYNAACDVLATDIYPVSEPKGKHSLEPNREISMVGDYTKRMVQLAEGKKLVFMILQVYWSGVNPKHNPKNKEMFPTAKEERYMTYQAIINGANSLSYFGLALKPDPAGSNTDKKLGCNWTYWRSTLKPLLAEIKQGSELYPALVAPDAKAPVKFSGAPQIEVRCKQTEDALWILAAAREGKAQKVTFSGVPDGAVKVVYENRNLQSSSGTFSDTFAEHDVHVYRISTAAQRR